MSHDEKLTSAFQLFERDDGTIEVRVTTNTTLGRLVNRLSSFGLAHHVRRVTADIGDHLYGGFFRNGFVIVFEGLQMTVVDVVKVLEVL